MNIHSLPRKDQCSDTRGTSQASLLYFAFAWMGQERIRTLHSRIWRSTIVAKHLLWLTQLQESWPVDLNATFWNWQKPTMLIILEQNQWYEKLAVHENNSVSYLKVRISSISGNSEILTWISEVTLSYVGNVVSTTSLATSSKISSICWGASGRKYAKTCCLLARMGNSTTKLAWNIIIIHQII